MQDPLSELVKVDPKSIGVGQYQHDVDQRQLHQSLESVIESCVNRVGVDLNTSSWTLLRYVAGVTERTAHNIVNFRNENGSFRSRAQLRKVPGIGPKTFEQAAGFLRIRNGENLLDMTAVHPESYQIVEQIAPPGWRRSSGWQPRRAGTIISKLKSIKRDLMDGCVLDVVGINYIERYVCVQHETMEEEDECCHSKIHKNCRRDVVSGPKVAEPTDSTSLIDRIGTELASALEVMRQSLGFGTCSRYARETFTPVSLTATLKSLSGFGADR